MASILVPALFAIGTHAVVPAGGGLEAVDVTVDASAGVLRVKRGAGAAKEVEIPIEKARIDAAGTTIDVIAIGGGKSVARIRVPDAQRKDLAFEAIVAASSAEPIFAGLTGYTRGAEGDRSGDVVLVHDGAYVVVAEAREDTRICGQSATPLSPRVLDADTMTLRGATLHRIDAKERAAATRVVATKSATIKPPLARVLSATGGSAPGAPRITDGKTDTTWSEQRGGDGHGEFVTMRAPAELPIHSLWMRIAPPTPLSTGAAPRTFFVATDAQLFHVTMPEDAWMNPGQTYDVALPGPIKTQCVAIVLDEAYARGMPAPEVQIAEVSARTQFDADGAAIDDVVKELSGPRASEAAALLKRSGDDGLAAVLARFPELQGNARALAVDIAASAGSCDGPSADLLTSALGDRDVEVKRRAMGRLERCGKAAGPALAKAVRSEDEARRTAAAPLLAAVAPSLALEPLLEQMGRGSSDTRRSVRAAFARVATSSAARDKLTAAVQRHDLPLAARLDILRGATAKLPELRPDSAAAIADILKSAPDMQTRWLVLGPLGALARSQDATTGELSRLAEIAQRDPDWPVRARAIELSAGIAPLAPIVLAATEDPEPRVRESALRAVASSSIAAGAPRASRALAADAWTFVRVAAADALAAIPSDGAALAGALDDKSPKVRIAAITALAKQRLSGQAKKIRERLDDGREDADVRAASARALGLLCERSAADRLTKLAHLARAPVDEADDRIGVAAIEALGLLHPADLEQRLAPLRTKETRLPVRRAAERALTEPNACR